MIIENVEKEIPLAIIKTLEIQSCARGFKTLGNLNLEKFEIP